MQRSTLLLKVGAVPGVCRRSEATGRRIGAVGPAWGWSTETRPATTSNTSCRQENNEHGWPDGEFRREMRLSRRFLPSLPCAIFPHYCAAHDTAYSSSFFTVTPADASRRGRVVVLLILSARAQVCDARRRDLDCNLRVRYAAQ